MKISISYEKISSDIETFEISIKSSNLSLEILLDFMPNYLDRRAKCWTYNKEANTWIACNTDSALIYLAKAFKYENPGLEFRILFRENKLSPNSSPLRNRIYLKY